MLQSVTTQALRQVPERLSWRLLNAQKQSTKAAEVIATTITRH
jgi:hypothetical protein